MDRRLLGDFRFSSTSGGGGRLRPSNDAALELGLPGCSAVPSDATATDRLGFVAPDDSDCAADSPSLAKAPAIGAAPPVPVVLVLSADNSFVFALSTPVSLVIVASSDGLLLLLPSTLLFVASASSFVSVGLAAPTSASTAASTYT